DCVFIYLRPKEESIQAAKELESQYPDRNARPPLFGIPFTVKDSIDIAGLQTTTGCPPLARSPAESAVIYDRVINEGAFFIGKTNLEQLATGMTGSSLRFAVKYIAHNLQDAEAHTVH
ncbi:MAG: Elongation of fatty acids protein 2, partial [Chaenotheca gracillima]